MVENNTLVFTYAYVVSVKLRDVPEGVIMADVPEYLPGYFVGNPNNPTKGLFSGRNNLKWVAAKAAEKSRELSLLVDMTYEGLAADERMILLLQPIQEDPENYKPVEELVATYFPKKLDELLGSSDVSRLTD